VAVLDDLEYEYPWEVKFRIKQHDVHDYSSAAHYINQSSADLVNLQHEFGLFGGVDGDYLLPLLDTIDKPLITNFHTILPEPDEHKLYIMKRIIEQSAAAIAMTESSRRLLIDVYGCPANKAISIGHGVPDFTFNQIAYHKQKLRIKASPMILIAGLIGPGKGLEYVIDALPAILKAIPTAKVYIVGQTHPHILKAEGEKYRESIMGRVKKLRVSRAVTFVNRYLDEAELKRYFLAADFFVTAFPNVQQPTSGTLAWAIAAGKVCISTPYHHAREMLANDIGILVEPGNAQAIADSIIATWKNQDYMLKLRQSAYQKGRQITWPNIGMSYLELFRLITRKVGGRRESPVDAFAMAH
jgi:glycosyltransferase involved in cell wall biosynthesis